MEELNTSLRQYNEQLLMINEAVGSATNDTEREPLLALQSELQVLIQLTQESLDALSAKENSSQSKDVSAKESMGQSNTPSDSNKNELDEEYELFMREMAKSGAYEADQGKSECSKDNQQDNEDSSDIEDDLSTLLGMKCAVYHTHKWGGQPSLHNAMVSAVVPRQDDDQFKDLQVHVLFTHPTHAEMLPCPFYLDGECRFNDEQCRYSHGATMLLSDLKDAIEPNFDSIRIGTRILLKLKPPDDEDISLTKKSTEKYHLWHRAIVKSVDFEKRVCFAKLEHGVKTGEKRKASTDEYHVSFEEIFPLNTGDDSDTDSDDSLSDTDYPENKALRSTADDENRMLLIEKSLQSTGPAMGEWERHTRGIGSKLMLAMGYVPGSGLGAAGAGRVQPVEARALPVGKSLDHCMAISDKAAAQDPLKVEQKLRRLQKKEEERNKRAYEREKEREKRNVFNFLNRTLGNEPNTSEASQAVPPKNIKQTTSKDLNIEKFKIAEDTRKIERDISKLNSSLVKYPSTSEVHRNLSLQILEKNKQLNVLKNKEQQIAKEQNHRKNKQNMTLF